MKRRLGPSVAVLVACVMFAGALSAPASADSSLGEPVKAVTIRLAGADRYETAVKVSQYVVPNPFTDSGNVVVVNGTSFPDALAASNLDALGGPPSSLLFVTRDRVPEVTLREIERLKPRWIWVVGGTGVIDPAVVRQLGALAPDGAHRLGGNDRWQTARKVAVESNKINNAMGMPTFHAALASGVDFPDALSFNGGGLLFLTKPTSLPSETVAAMSETGVDESTELVVHGGSGAISEYALADLKRRGVDVIRLAGADRYETAALSSYYEKGKKSQEVWYASGENYPDALAGLQATGPLLLTRASCVPKITQTATAALGPITRVIIGGEKVATLSKPCP